MNQSILTKNKENCMEGMFPKLAFITSDLFMFGGFLLFVMSF